jgi:polysaccharide export outer membrane protein
MMMFLSLFLFVQAQKTIAPDYVVGAQDRLSITVFDEPTLTKTVTIDNDGTFDFPLIGRVKAAGLTVRLIEDDLKKRLGADYLVSPQVSIEVETYRSQIVYVQGEVRTPGFVPLKGAMTIMDALAQAGSTTTTAGNYVEVYRHAAGQSTSGPVDLSKPPLPPLRLSMDDLRSGRAQGILLGDGDTILVPKAQTFIVNGYVRTPGTYVLDGQVTVQRALAMAGGVAERGAQNRTKILRMVNGKLDEIKAKMSDLVQPNDTIYVPQRFF